MRMARPSRQVFISIHSTAVMTSGIHAPWKSLDTLPSQ